MKKRVYRATNVKKINLEKLAQELEGKDIVLGVDVAKEDFMAAIMDKDRKVIKTIKWKHPFESKRSFNPIFFLSKKYGSVRQPENATKDVYEHKNPPTRAVTQSSSLASTCSPTA